MVDGMNEKNLEEKLAIEEFFQKYILDGEVDKVALALLLEEAKGSERNMSAFSREAGLTKTQVSRIMNRQIIRALPKQVLVKIFEARANKSDIDLLRRLANANGMKLQLKEVVYEKPTSAFSRQFEEERRFKNLLLGSMVSAGLIVRGVDYEDCEKKSPSQFSVLSPSWSNSFKVEFSVPRSDRVLTWEFFLFTSPYSALHGRKREDNLMKKVLREKIHVIAPRFMKDAWEPDELSETKTSFVFTNRELYCEFNEVLAVAKLHSEMTSIYINLETFVVEEEHWLPSPHRKESSDSIFYYPSKED